MRLSIIRRIVGYVLLLEAALLLLPCIVALIYGESQGIAYIAVAGICLLFGCILAIKKPVSNVFYLKESCVATALSWIFLSIFGALPFFITGEIPSFTDALFESTSGFSTTGASILTDVEALSHCSLFWRSLTNWIGGMGVLVFILAVVPLSGGSNINLLRAESPGPTVSKVVPKMRTTAGILYGIYMVMTVLEVIFLLIGKIPLFDALTISISTAGTGGFGIKNDSLGAYSTYIQWVVTIFMMLFGVNFNAYCLILFRQFKKALKMEEVICYFIIILAAIYIILINTAGFYDNVFEAFTQTAFQVSSIITTTGYSTADYNLWPVTSKVVIVFLMFTGGCAGSTSGGFKISRIIVALKTVFKEFKSYIHPKRIFKIKMDGKTVAHDVVRATNAYFLTFVTLFVISIFLISFDNFDLVTSFTSVIAALNNIGPGLELVGPKGNFSAFGDFSKFVLIFDMLAGRLELFPLLLLFYPSLWKEAASQSNTKLKKSIIK